MAEPIEPTTRARRRDLEQTFRTSMPTEGAVRDLTRTLAVKLGRTPTHDEVIRASVQLASVHMTLLVEYLERAE